MTAGVFEALEKALVKKEADKLLQHLIQTVNTSCAMFDRPSYDEPFGYANLAVAKQALYLAALPAIENAAQDRVFRKLLQLLGEFTDDWNE